MSSGPVASTTLRVRAASSYGSAPIFSWNAMDALGAPRGDVRRHLLGRPERHGEVEREALRQPAAEQVADGQADEPPERVPAGGVDRALRVRVPHQRPVHRRVDGGEVARVEPDDGGRELARAPRGRPPPCDGR